VNCPPFLISLSFWVELVGACNSIWYQGQRSRVQVLAGALIKIITAHSKIHVCGLGGAAREGECRSISELPNFPHQKSATTWGTSLLWLLQTAHFLHSCITLLKTHFAFNGLCTVSITTEGRRKSDIPTAVAKPEGNRDSSTRKIGHKQGTTT
jgi:hypothetical protein